MQRQTFKLIVTVTDNCIETCQYICKNITEINKMGVRVHVEKISKGEFDEVMVDSLRRKGITRLPALVAPDGKLFIGMKNIIDLFEKNLRPVRNTQRVGAIDSEMGSNPDLTSFYMKELYSGIDNNGKMVPRADDEDENDDHAAITKSLANYNKKVPRHRQEQNREIDIVPQPRQRQRHQQYEDNIENDDDDYDAPALRMREQPVSNNNNMGEDDLDNRMMAAWMSNNPD